MGAILTDLGEEYLIKNGFGSVTFNVGLYNDGTDLIADTDDLAAITTEPADGNYVRQSFSITATEVQDLSGDWGVEFTVTFDVTNTTGTVDSGFCVVNFTAEDTADTVATDHLVATAALSQSRDLSQIDSLNVTVTITLS